MAEEVKKSEDILEKIKREVTNFKKKKKALIDELRLEFPKLLIPFMQESNYIENISWTQYTPYFNDGDTCEFSVNTDYLEINGEDEYSNKMYKELLSVKIKDQNGIDRDKLICEEKGQKYRPKKIGEYGYKKNIEYSKNEGVILKNIKKVLSEIPEDFYQDLFGDHSKITVTKEGVIRVEEYDHD